MFPPIETGAAVVARLLCACADVCETKLLYKGCEIAFFALLGNAASPLQSVSLFELFQNLLDVWAFLFSLLMLRFGARKTQTRVFS